MSGVLVCVTPYVPYDGIDHAGGEYLRRYLAVAAASGWEVRLIAPDNPTNRTGADGSSYEVDLHPDTPRPLRALALAVSGVPVRTGRAWLRGLSARSRRWLAEADLVELHWADASWNAPSLRRLLPGTPLVGLAYDLRTQSLRRAWRDGSGLARLEAGLALPRVRRAEAAALSACDRVLVFKDDDRLALQALGVRTDILVAPVPVPAAQCVPPPDLGSRRVLFSGAMFRPENLEAATWLLDEVLPLVRAEAPDVVVRLAGSRPPEALRARASAVVEVTGYLDDLLDAYAGVACVAVPLRRGAGVKFKTVEAVTAGYPVVSTTVGAEGVVEAAGVGPSSVVDDAPGFARALLDALDGRLEARAVPERASFEQRAREILDGYAEIGRSTDRSAP